MVGEKRVPRRHFAVVDEKPHGVTAGHEAVEYKPEVTTNALDAFEESVVVLGVVGALVAGEAVEILPEHGCAMWKGGEARKVGLTGHVCGAEKTPIILGRDQIEIPAARLKRFTGSAGARGEAATLREGCSLESQTEATEIVRLSFSERTSTTEAHRFDQFIGRHTVTVIGYAYDRSGSVPLEVQPDTAGSGRNTVIYEIGECCG